MNPFLWFFQMYRFLIEARDSTEIYKAPCLSCKNELKHLIIWNFILKKNIHFLWIVASNIFLKRYELEVQFQTSCRYPANVNQTFCIRKPLNFLHFRPDWSTPKPEMFHQWCNLQFETGIRGPWLRADRNYCCCWEPGAKERRSFGDPCRNSIPSKMKRQHFAWALLAIYEMAVGLASSRPLC